MFMFRIFLKLFNDVSRNSHTYTLIMLGALLLLFLTGIQISKSNLTQMVSHPALQGRIIKIKDKEAIIPDVEVVNQHGQRVRLYSDLIKDKVVLLSFFYASCGYICPMQGAVLSKLQSKLGDRLGKDVFLISISIDPDRDDPQQLHEWANHHKVKDGWTLIVGNNAEVKKMIEDFTGNRPGPKEIHASFVFIGNDKTENWLSAEGLASPEHLTSLINQVT